MQLRNDDGGVAGIILAGGDSTRMGTDKALAEYRGTPFVTLVARALEAVAGTVLIVGRAGELAGIECVPDDRPEHRGPLAGLATALRRGIAERFILVAVDQPLVRTATLAALLDLTVDRPVVPVDRGVRQITCAVYPASLAPAAAAADEAGGSIQRLLAGIPVRDVLPDEWRRWGEDGRSWFSIDDPAVLAEAEHRFG